MIRILLSIAAIAALVSPLSGQEAKTIYFEEDPIILEPNGHGYTVLYKVLSDTIKHRGDGGFVRYPENFSAQDTAYTTIYFTGCESGKLDREQLVLVENYKSASPRLWVDQNGNFDFSDDGSPFDVSEDGEVIISLSNCENENGFFQVRLYRIEADSAQLYQRHSFGQPGRTRGGEFILDPQYWFADQRMNTRTFTGVIDDIPVKIGLMDWNCDGLYNTVGEDKLMVSTNLNAPHSTKNVFGTITLSDTAFVFIDNIPFAIQKVDPAGNHISFKSTNQNIPRPVLIGDELPDYSFPLGNQEISISEALGNKEYLLIDVWGTWCGGCIQQTPFLLELYNNHIEQLNVLGLNYGDTPEKIADYVNKYNLPWMNATLTPEFKEELNIEGFPSYLLLDADGKLVYYTFYTFEISEFLESLE